MRLVVALAVAVVVLGWAAVRDADPSGRLNVQPVTAPTPAEVESGLVTDPASEIASGPLRVLPVLPGHWTAVGAPIPGGAAPAVWSPTTEGGGELIVVAGQGGAPRKVSAFDPRTGRWRSLPPPPGETAFGAGHVLVWTGHELVVWGRWEPTRMQPHGSALDPTTNVWRELPTAPIEDLGPAPVAVWTGTEVIIWGPTLERVFRPGVRPAGVAYDPLSDAWRRLPDPPVRGVVRAGGIWTPAGLVVWGSARDAGTRSGGTTQPFALRYEPLSNHWTLLSPPPLAHAEHAAAIDTGQAVVLWGQPLLSQRGGPPAAAELPHGERRWRGLPPLPSGPWPATATNVGATAAWTGGRLLSATGQPPLIPLALDQPGPDGRWLRLGDWSQPARTNATAVWTGQELLVWGGFLTEGTPAGELLTWTPATDAPAQETAPGPRRLPSP
jgi:hypothetical protein